MAYRNSLTRARRHGRAWIAAVCLIASQLARANIDVEISGVDDQLRTNVLAYLSFERYKQRTDISADTAERLHNRVEREVQAALKPFGYYEPQVNSEVKDLGHGDWQVTIDIDPGTPVLIDKIDVRVQGPGASDPLFQRITSNPPLHSGDRLSHAARYTPVTADRCSESPVARLQCNRPPFSIGKNLRGRSPRFFPGRSRALRLYRTR